MAASANPRSHSNVSDGDGTEKVNGGGGVSEPKVRHNPGLSLDWTPEEQSALECLLAKHASETNFICYSKIAEALRDKTVRDIAFRCRWMSDCKKETGKRRKDDSTSSRKNKDKREKVTDPLPQSSQGANRTNSPPYAQSMDCDDGIPFSAIGGTVGQLLEHNSLALDQISANFSACTGSTALIFSIHENIPLFCRARDNIISLLNDSSGMPEIMKQMPPLPVKLNELANSFLSRMPLPTNS